MADEAKKEEEGLSGFYVLIILLILCVAMWGMEKIGHWRGENEARGAFQRQATTEYLICTWANGLVREDNQLNCGPLERLSKFKGD